MSKNKFNDINEFEIIKKKLWGEGSYANVFLAKNKLDGLKYALKIIDLKDIDSNDLYIIKREIYTHSLMNHPNIIKLLGFIKEKTRIIIIMDYANNGDLFNLINNQSLKPDQIKNIIKQIVNAFVHIHSKKVIHRDLKPENILLDKKFNVKICDFGWSAESFEETKRETFCGTYEYMSPEILCNKKQTTKTDIWSIGILIYEIIHLKAPFEGRTAIEVKNQISKNKIKFKKNIDKKLIDLILKCWKINPDSRLTATEILDHDYFKVLKEKNTNKIN